MKKSIKYLPKEQQEDLMFFVNTILEKIPETEMIILYGNDTANSTASLNTSATLMDDYDILVITDKTPNRKYISHILDNIGDIYYNTSNKQTTISFIYEDIYKVNKALANGRFFYTLFKKEGILLYDKGNFKLVRRHKLRYGEIKQQAEKHFNENIERATSFMRSTKHDYSDSDFRMAAFHLHQVCENLLRAVSLVFTLENYKHHNLLKLLTFVKKYAAELDNIFPRESQEEKRLFNLLKQAYIEARYNPDYIITKEDINFLIPSIEQLFNLVEELCEKRIESYAKAI